MWDAMRKRVSSIGEKAIETEFVRNIIFQIRHNKLFTKVYSEFERIHAKKMLEEIKKKPVPTHLAIIMDGNRRYAFEKGLNPQEGHQKGKDKLENVVEWCHEVGIKALTVYAFSTENFNRPKKEVEHLMDMFEADLKKIKSDKRTHENKVRVKVIGQLERLPERVRKEAERIMEETKDYDAYYFNIAIGYGGREEIVDAVKKIAFAVKDGKINPSEIKEKVISSYLYTFDTPDPDLILRTSGEERISNFLLWQLAYSELYFTDVYWPALKKTDFLKVIHSYQSRQRRYGT